MFTRSKEKDIPIATKPAPNPFDPRVIKKCVYEMLPEGWPQKRLKTGVFIIESFWKNGSLNRIDVDGQNVSDHIERMDVETALETLLVNSKRFRRNYTGKIKLTVKIKDEVIISLYKEDGNFMPFDPKTIQEQVYAILPDEYPQKRLENGLFVIEIFWKHGEVKKIDVDQQNITDVINIEKTGKSLEVLLTSSNRFRRNYTGRMKFTVKTKSKEIVSIYKEEGNFIITESTINHGRN